MIAIQIAVRTELVEVHSLVRAYQGEGVARCAGQAPRSVRKHAALPFDGLRANGSTTELFLVPITIALTERHV